MSRHRKTAQLIEIAAELLRQHRPMDALPIEVLRNRIVTETESRMDLAALQRAQAIQEGERQLLVRALSAIGGRA